LEGRRYTDLSKLTPVEGVYGPTRSPDIDPRAAWSVSIGGLVQRSVGVSMDELLAPSVDQGEHLLECSGNFREGGFGLMSVGRFRAEPEIQAGAMPIRVERWKDDEGPFFLWSSGLCREELDR